MIRLLLPFAATIAMAAFAMTAQPARAVLFDVSWTGSAGYSLSGTLGIDDSLLGAGAIDEADIASLAFTGFHNGNPVGSWGWLVDGLSGGANFNFNFDATTETFLTGGHAASPTGQQWNTAICAGTFAFGFFSGNATQGFCLTDGSMVGMIAVANSTLIATRHIDIAEPAGLGLFGLALAGFGIAGFEAAGFGAVLSGARRRRVAQRAPAFGGIGGRGMPRWSRRVVPV